MRSRGPEVLWLAGLVGIIAVGGCSTSNAKPAAGKASDARAVCAQASLDALTLSGRMGAAGYAHRAAPSELAEIDASIASLRREVSGLPVNARDALSSLIEAASHARAALVLGQAPDASVIVRAQQQFATTCNV